MKKHGKFGVNKIFKKRRNFWKNKKVFITGHTGFKGSWLVIFLNLLNAKLSGYSQKPKKVSLFNQAGCYNLLKNNFYSDINKLKDLKKKLNISKPEIVFHLAAQPLVSESYLSPLKTFKANIIGTANLIEACKNIKSIKVIIIITTDKVYKINKKNKAFRETDELGGKDPYSASKACAEIVVNSYYESYFKSNSDKVKMATARSGNVLGGGDYSKNRIIPDILNAINKKKELIIRNPNQIRPWQHVIEPIYGYIILAEKLFLNQIGSMENSWNFGPKNNSFIKVYQLLDKINKIKKLKKISLKKNNYKETEILKLNSNKSKKYLKWIQKWDINETIKKILEWNENYINKKNILKTCEAQIKSYFK